MFANLTVSLDTLKSIDKASARKLLLEDFRVGNLDANEVFAVASELNIELSIR